jgi:hypothetical protein
MESPRSCEAVIERARGVTCAGYAMKGNSTRGVARRGKRYFGLPATDTAMDDAEQEQEQECGLRHARGFLGGLPVLPVSLPSSIPIPADAPHKLAQGKARRGGRSATAIVIAIVDPWTLNWPRFSSSLACFKLDLADWSIPPELLLPTPSAFAWRV